MERPVRAFDHQYLETADLLVLRAEIQKLQIGRKVRRCATIGGKTAQISQGRHRFSRADGKGLGQHPSLDLP